MDDKYQDIQVYNWKTHSYVYLIREVHITNIQLTYSYIKIYYIPYKSNEETSIIFEKRNNTLEIG